MASDALPTPAQPAKWALSRPAAAAVTALAVLLLLAVLVSGGVLPGATRSTAIDRADAPFDPTTLHAHPHAVQPAAGVIDDGSAAATGTAAATASNDAIGGQIHEHATSGDPTKVDAEMRQLYATAETTTDLAGPPTAQRASGAVAGNGTLRLSKPVPAVIADVIRGGNAIATLPYLWGGGHGSWISPNGYDCSGSVSYALAAGGLLNRTMVSGEFMTWGQPGPGRWITIYASPTHVWMVVAGHRFDTVALSQTGSRWTDAPQSAAGFVVRHPTAF